MRIQPRSSGRVALVTCRVLPEPDPDQDLLLAALRDRGLGAELLAWDDPNPSDGASPGAFDLCVLRSCWNYPTASAAFLAWCERAAAASRLANPLPAVRWNLHKRYLRELERAGVPVVPTAWLERGEAEDLGEILARHGWSDVVVKPAISAASLHTRRFQADRERDPDGERVAGRRFLAELAAERDVMIQPFMTSVEREGERALIWIAGELTHAIRKNPRFAGEDEAVSEETVPISPAERAAGEAAVAFVRERVLDPTGPDLLYARIDLMTDESGAPRISELELMEPSLFLVQDRGALDRLVGAIARIVSASAPAAITSP